MLFAGLFAAFFFVRNQADVWPPNGVERYLKITGYNVILTIILLTSGLFAHTAVVQLRQNKLDLFRFCLILTIILGTIFIGMQANEWLGFIRNDGFNASKTVYGGTFFVMTGFHGAHVIAGLLMLVAVTVRAYWNDFTPSRYLFVDTSVLYWHFVDV